MMFSTRSYETEIMDDFSVNDKRITVALNELNIINRFLGGNSTTKAGLITIIRNNPDKKELKILDAGSGSSDIIKLNNLYKFDIYCLDRNKAVCKYAKEKSQTKKIIFGDVFQLPFRDKQFDVVHASLFLHHFNEKEIRTLLNKFIKASKQAVLINDLRRSVFAYFGIKLLTKMFSKSEMVKNDGPLSVKKGFIKPELKEILNSFPQAKYIIKRKWAFRWLVIIFTGGKNYAQAL
jgi:ubiquinone/menaquinone biosynthesis C-methylase UbiE